MKSSVDKTNRCRRWIDPSQESQDLNFCKSISFWWKKRRGEFWHRPRKLFSCDLPNLHRWRFDLKSQHQHIGGQKYEKDGSATEKEWREPKISRPKGSPRSSIVQWTFHKFLPVRFLLSLFCRRQHNYLVINFTSFSSLFKMQLIEEP